MPAPLEVWRNGATVVSAAISLAAFFRPELQKLLAKFRGQLLIYPVGERIEIGFGGAGATIGTEFILRARTRDFFVRDGSVEVVRQRDGARHTFSWGAFRPPTLISGPPQQTVLEVPAGFLLETRAPRRLNIAFQDRNLRDEITSILIPNRERWQNRLTEAGFFSPPNAENIDHRTAIEDLYDHFSREQEPIQAWTALQRTCYWLPGEYTAVFSFNSTEPERVFAFKCNFSLTQNDSDRLHANAIPMLRQSVGFTDLSLSFVYPKLQLS